MPIYEEKEKVNGQKRYYIRTYVLDLDGKSIQKEKHNKNWIGLDGKREAQRIENIMRSNININSTITLNELANYYLDSCKPNFKVSTYKAYKEAIDNHILPYFQNKKIYHITTKDILDWKNIIDNKTSDKTKKPLAYKFKRNIFIVFSALLNYGCIYYNLENNVVRIVGNFKQQKGTTKKEMQFLTEEEFNKFIKYEENPIYRDFFTTLFYTGMRRGELLALTYEDISDDEITINKSINPKNGSVATTPKTDKSNRKIKMLSNVKKILHKKNSGTIFKDIKTTTLCRKCNNNIKSANINKQIRIHDFRHSFASMCIYKGVPINILSGYLGHQNITTTLNIYSHLYPNSQDEMIKLLETSGNTSGEK